MTDKNDIHSQYRRKLTQANYAVMHQMQCFFDEFKDPNTKKTKDITANRAKNALGAYHKEQLKSTDNIFKIGLYNANGQINGTLSPDSKLDKQVSMSALNTYVGGNKIFEGIRDYFENNNGKVLNLGKIMGTVFEIHEGYTNVWSQEHSNLITKDSQDLTGITANINADAGLLGKLNNGNQIQEDDVRKNLPKWIPKIYGHIEN